MLCQFALRNTHWSRASYFWVRCVFLGGVSDEDDGGIMEGRLGGVSDDISVSIILQGGCEMPEEGWWE